jgi:acetylornithine deacetylase/succinyl-diaminopimelate desuccinylase-like protein
MRRGLVSWIVLVLSTAGATAVPAGAVDFDASARSARTLLGELVAADTSNPPGNESRAVAIGAARLRQAGIPYRVTEFAPGRENLVARIEGKGGAGALLLLAHTDVAR